MAGEETVTAEHDAETPGPPVRRRRANAQRNIDALVDAARAVFATSGVDAPAKEITDRAGVGVGTLYRHFPKRSDLVVAVVQHGADACVAAAATLGARHDPGTALRRWLDELADFVGTKRGLATALHSGDPAFAALPGYFMERLEPALAALLDAAAATGEVRADVDARELLFAVALLCQPVTGVDADYNRRMVALLADGLRQPAGAR